MEVHHFHKIAKKINTFARMTIQKLILVINFKLINYNSTIIYIIIINFAIQDNATYLLPIESLGLQFITSSFILQFGMYID